MLCYKNAQTHSHTHNIELRKQRVKKIYKTNIKDNLCTATQHIQAYAQSRLNANSIFWAKIKHIQQTLPLPTTTVEVLDEFKTVKRKEKLGKWPLADRRQKRATMKIALNKWCE